MHQIDGQLTPTAPFDFTQSVRFIGEFAPTLPDQQIAGQTMTRAVYVNGQPIIFQVRNAGHSPEHAKLDYTLYAEQPITREIQYAAEDRIRFFLSTDDDLRSFYAIGKRDIHFKPVIEQLYGYHQVKFITPFENAIWAILTQRNPLQLAQRMKAAIIKYCGAQLTLEDEGYPVFPEAGMLAAVAEDKLGEIIGHAQKSKYIHAASEAFASVDEEWLRNAPYEDVQNWLLNIKGIGAWSAAFVMIRGLGRVEQFPTEKRLLEIASARYEQTITEQELARLGEPYGKWRGYWAHYLRASA